MKSPSSADVLEAKHDPARRVSQNDPPVIVVASVSLADQMTLHKVQVDRNRMARMLAFGI
jgi:hypothetical protein